MSGIDQPRLVFFYVIFHVTLQNVFVKTGNFSMRCLSNNNIRRHCVHKYLRIELFDTLYNLWQVV